jgi:alpha-methylacyl-CoA racemase
MKVVEFGGIGPGPLCAQMLADMGADIIRIDRKGDKGRGVHPKYNILHRSRRSVVLDLKKPEGIEAALKLIGQADALIEGFRPGVMERIGLGPDVCLKRNPRIVYGRMTGWGQEGPISQAAGHDINYISLVGALHAIGRPGEKPVPPLNLIGDFGGGGMLLAYGIMCGVYEAQKSGQGQVVDAAMTDGAAILMGIFYGMWAAGQQTTERGTNRLDGGAHFYDAYETSDGKYISVGSIEPKFYAELLKYTEIDDPEFQYQMDRSKWPMFKEKLSAVFKTKTRDEWCDIMEGTDVCFAPVLDFEESINHPQNRARNTFVEVEGVFQPGPAPRFSRTVPEIQSRAPWPGEHSEVALADWDFTSDEIQTLKDEGVIQGHESSR